MEQQEYMTEEGDQYAGLLERVKAVFIDSLVLIFSTVIFTQVFSTFESIPDAIRIIAAILIFALYDPLCVSFWGGTLGHRMIGIRIKNEDYQTKNITLPMAMLRFVVKASLGWISLVTITGNDRRKAVHDMMVGSVVVYK